MPQSFIHGIYSSWSQTLRQYVLDDKEYTLSSNLKASFHITNDITSNQPSLIRTVVSTDSKCYIKSPR